MTPWEALTEMMERGAQVEVFTRESAPDSDAGPTIAFGAIVRCENDDWMAVEISQTARGEASISVRGYTAAGEAKPLVVLGTDESVMVSFG